MTKRSGRRVVIAGGGTGGHVFPGLALAGELRRRQPARPIEWIGARGGLEESLVPRAGFPLTVLPMAGMARAGMIGRLRAAILAALATLRLAVDFLRRRPALLVGVGGFASGPAVLAAALQGVPTLLLEQNAIAGATNRWLSRIASATAASFESSRRDLAGRVVVTGNPVRPEIAAIAAWTPHQPPVVVGFGGSRGARALNEAWTAALPLLHDFPFELILQTGPDAESLVRAAALGRPGIVVRAFLDDMPAQLERADLVVARAGATTVAELTAAGRPAVLVPFPFAANDHQRANARELLAAGAARVIDQDDLTPERLAAVVRELLAAPADLQAMAMAARALGRPQATANVTQLAEELIGGVA